MAFKEQVFRFPGMWGLMGKGWGPCQRRVALRQRLHTLARSAQLVLSLACSRFLPGSAVTLELVRPAKPAA